MRRSTTRFSLVCILTFALLLWPSLAPGLEKAPGFSLKDITDMEGDDVTLEDYKGKIVLLNVFTTT